MIFKKKPDISLTWEWLDGRTSDYKITITVISIKAQSKGLFGIKQSPSVIGWIPDGLIVNGIVVSEDTALSGKLLKITLPEDEIKNTKISDKLSLGVVNDEICIEARKV